MDIQNLTIVLLAGDPKCLNLIGWSQESYLERSLRAGSDLGCSIVLVHHRDVPAPSISPRLLCVPAGEKMIESVAAGIAVCQTPYILVLATDLPLVMAAAVRDFAEQACATDAEVSIALADLAACKKLGYSTSHPIPLGGKQYKFGSAFVMRREASGRILEIVRDLIELRKQPIQLVRRFLSWRFLFQALRFAFSNKFTTLSLRFDEAERLFADRVGIRARGIVADPSLAIDHD